MGLSDQTGNEIDEFINDTLRNNLLGLPLDLATLNMTRARSEGIPTLNNVRKQINAATNDGQLVPYTNWIDFGEQIKHPESLINFVAAYGRHPTILHTVGPDGVIGTADDGAPTLASRRAAATLIVDPPMGTDPATIPSDAGDFMFSTGPWADVNGTSITGLDDVDLWVGGLAENTNLFGGLLGSTFNYVFEKQLTDLQNGDRLYYLARTPGMNLRAQLEGNSFAEMIMRNSTAHSLKADAFGTADCKFELANLNGTPAGYAATGATVIDDPASECDETALLLRMPDGTIRYRATNSVDPPGINGQSVYNGVPGTDRIWGGNDNDTMMGNDAADNIQGAGGDDVAIGGLGNDIIIDSGGADVPKGGPGNDALDGGIGDDVVMGGDGSDFMNGGANDNETFSGNGNDFVIAGQGADAVFGDSGDDWIEGGSGQDLLQGESGAPFFDDPNAPGHDVLIGQVGENDYDTEGGDDIMLSYPAVERNAAAAGWDWVSGQYDGTPMDSDLNLSLINLVLPIVVNRDRYQEVEAVAGSPFDDIIRGDDVVPTDVGGAGFTGCDALDQAGVDRISGLADILPELVTPMPQCPQFVGPTFGAGNILLGGAGSDLLEGRGADDIIDGDRFLTVRISVRTDVTDPATEIGTTGLMESQATSGSFGTGTAGMTLQQAVFAGLVDPGKLAIVREVKTAPPVAGDADTALFSGPAADYDITPQPDGSVTVDHARGAATDGIDTLRNVERVQFADQSVTVSTLFNSAATGTVAIDSTTPTEGSMLTADASTIVDADGFDPALVVLTWQAQTDPTTWVSVANGPTFTPTNAEVGAALRVVANFTDNKGLPEQVTGPATAPVLNVNDPPVGVPTISGTAQATIALTATTTGISDADGLSGAFDFQWRLNGAPIAGATGATFTPTPAMVGGTVRVVVSYTDLHGTDETVTSAATSAVLPPPAPIATLSATSLAFGTLSTVSGFSTQTITVTNDGDANLNIGAVTKSGTSAAAFAVGPGCTNTVVGPSATCTISVVFNPASGGAGAKSAQIRIASNAGPNKFVTLSATSVINQAPTGTPALSSTTPENGVALTATTGTIADGDGLVGAAFGFRWQQNNVGGGGAFTDIVGATGSSFTPTPAQLGRRLRVVVTFVDNHGTHQTVNGAATAIVSDVFVGTEGADTWTGTAGSDRASGNGGNDSLTAAGGADRLSGGPGDDTIAGGAGNDIDRGRRRRRLRRRHGRC